MAAVNAIRRSFGTLRLPSTSPFPRACIVLHITLCFDCFVVRIAVWPLGALRLRVQEMGDIGPDGVPLIILCPLHCFKLAYDL